MPRGGHDHLADPALAFFIQLKHNLGLAKDLRPRLDTMYRGLLDHGAGPTFCLARELGESELGGALRTTLLAEVERGFELDPLLSGLYLLGDSLRPGSFRQLVQG